MSGHDRGDTYTLLLDVIFVFMLFVFSTVVCAISITGFLNIFIYAELPYTWYDVAILIGLPLVFLTLFVWWLVVIIKRFNRGFYDVHK